MKITEEMLDKACAVDPKIPRETILNILRSSYLGQIIFEDDAGELVVEGKSQWPSYIQLIINDPYHALEYSQQLLNGARNKLLRGNTDDAGIILMMAGTAMISD